MPVRIPPHDYRHLVNALRDTARVYTGTDQLRERLSSVLSAWVSPDHPHTRRPRCKLVHADQLQPGDDVFLIHSKDEYRGRPGLAAGTLVTIAQVDILHSLNRVKIVAHTSLTRAVAIPVNLDTPFARVIK